MNVPAKGRVSAVSRRLRCRSPTKQWIDRQTGGVKCWRTLPRGGESGGNMSRRLYLVLLSLTALTVAGLGFGCKDSQEDLPDRQTSTLTPLTPIAVPTSSSTFDTATKTPTLTSTTPSEWAVYTDPVLGFTFPHPGDLEAHDITPSRSGSPLADYPLRAVEFRPPGGNPLIALSVYTNLAGLTAVQWAKEFTACHFEDPYEIRDVTVDGGVGITCVAEPDMIEPSAVISRDGKIFFLATGLTDSDLTALLNGFRFPK